MESTAVISKRLVKALRALASADRERRTQLMREIAELSVDLREHFLDADGKPDWAARTWQYRDALREMYRDAGYNAEETKTIQAAVRYHVGNIVRLRLDAETIEDLGLLDAAPVERVREGREVRSALMAAATNTGGDLNIPRALASAYLILQRIDMTAFPELDDAGRSQVRALAGRIVTVAEEIAHAVVSAG